MPDYAPVNRLCHLSLALLLGCGASTEPGTSPDAGGVHFNPVDSVSVGADTSAPDAVVGAPDTTTGTPDATVGTPDTTGAPDTDPIDEEDIDPGDVAPPVQGDVFVEPPDPTLADQPLAGVCATGEDCETPDCNIYYPGGYCTLWCASSDECPDGGKCYKDPQSGDKMCWKACDVPDDCRVDQFCAGGVCTPKCWETSCQVGYECDSDSGQCLEIGAQPCVPVDEVCDGHLSLCGEHLLRRLVLLVGQTRPPRGPL